MKCTEHVGLKFAKCNWRLNLENCHSPFILSQVHLSISHTYIHSSVPPCSSLLCLSALISVQRCRWAFKSYCESACGCVRCMPVILGKYVDTYTHAHRHMHTVQAQSQHTPNSSPSFMKCYADLANRNHSETLKLKHIVSKTKFPKIFKPESKLYLARMFITPSPWYHDDVPQIW